VDNNNDSSIVIINGMFRNKLKSLDTHASIVGSSGKSSFAFEVVCFADPSILGFPNSEGKP
jgi:hypothetical protein